MSPMGKNKPKKKDKLIQDTTGKTEEQKDGKTEVKAKKVTHYIKDIELIDKLKYVSYRVKKTQSELLTEAIIDLIKKYEKKGIKRDTVTQQNRKVE